MRSRRSTAAASLVGCVALAALSAGCSPTISNHGYTPLPEEIAELQVGLDTRASVQSKIGRPGSTGIFTDNGWYYVSNRVEHLTYHAPEVVDRRVLELIFDPSDVLASVTEYGIDDGRVIDLETEDDAHLWPAADDPRAGLRQYRGHHAGLRSTNSEPPHAGREARPKASQASAAAASASPGTIERFTADQPKPDINAPELNEPTVTRPKTRKSFRPCIAGALLRPMGAWPASRWRR